MESATVPRPLVKRHHGLVRLAHWLNAIVLLGMIASGLQIYVAFSHFGIRGEPLPLPNPFDGGPIPKWGRLGGWRVMSFFSPRAVWSNEPRPQLFLRHQLPWMPGPFWLAILSSDHRGDRSCSPRISFAGS